jgi:site-specific DNA-methyltransferase (adenine-specific)
LRHYYEQDGIVIYHGDCREILPTLDPVDVVLTDPPYGDATHKGALGDGGRSALVDFASTTADAIRSAFAMTRARRWTVAFMEWRHIGPLEERPPEGMEFIRFGVWVKPNGAPQFTGDRPATGWEAVGIFHPPGKKRWNGGGHHAV